MCCILLGKVGMFESHIVVVGVMCPAHRYLIYTRWCIPHCGQAKIEARSQAKIEARSQALVVPMELTQSMIICVFCTAEMDKVDNKYSFIQLKSI